MIKRTIFRFLQNFKKYLIEPSFLRQDDSSVPMTLAMALNTPTTKTISTRPFDTYLVEWRLFFWEMGICNPYRNVGIFSFYHELINKIVVYFFRKPHFALRPVNCLKWKNLELKLVLRDFGCWVREQFSEKFTNGFFEEKSRQKNRVLRTDYETSDAQAVW